MRSKRIVTVLLTLCLTTALASIAMAEEFTLRNDIHFGDSMETVMEKETDSFEENDDGTLRITGKNEDGVYEIDEDKIKEDEEYCITESGVTISGYEDSYVNFWFKNDELIAMVYQIGHEDDIQSQYDSLHEGLQRKYGEPLSVPDGKTYIITTDALNMCMNLYNAWIDKFGAYLQSAEWVIDEDNGEHIKIEIAYLNSIFSQLNIGYRHYTDADLENYHNEQQEKNDIIDSDL